MKDVTEIAHFNQFFKCTNCNSVRYNRSTIGQVMKKVRQAKDYYTQAKNMSFKFLTLIHFFGRQLQDIFENISSEYSVNIKEKEKRIQSLQIILEDTKKRNSEFFKEIENEFKRKDQITSSLTQNVKDFKLRIIQLQQALNKKQNDCRNYKSTLQTLISEGDVQRRDNKQYIMVLEEEISRLRNDNQSRNDKPKGDDNNSSNMLQVINEVTETCLTTQKDQQDNFEQINQRFKQQINCERYDFRQDLEIMRKFSNDVHKSNTTGESNKQNLKDNLHKQFNQFPIKQTKKHTNFIKTFRHNLQESCQQFQQITKIECPQKIKLEFPSSKTLSLLPLNEVNPNAKNQTQNYIGGYVYQGNFDSNQQRCGYGVLKKEGQTIYSGGWKNGLYEGWGKLNLYHQKYSEYSGSFSKGFFSGRGTLSYANGNKYIGEIVADSIQGEGTFMKANSQVLFGVWKNNQLKVRY